MTTRSKTIISWLLRGLAALILLQTLFFKFTGAEESIAIYDCFAPVAAEQFPKKLATLDAFKSGINYYMGRSFTQAFISFQQVLDQNPEDKTAHFFLSKTAKYISSGVPEDWNGVEEMWEK